MALEIHRTAAGRRFRACIAVAIVWSFAVAELVAQPPSGSSPTPAPPPPAEIEWSGKSYRIEPDPVTGAPVLVLKERGGGPPVEPANSAPPKPASAAPPRTAPPAPLLTREQLVIGGVVAGLAAGVALYAFVLVPYRRRRPFVQAVRILQDDEIDRFDQAEEWLLDSLTRGLSQDDVADARFALAYLRIRSTRDEDAAAPLADLRQSGRMDADDAYLDLWLRFRREDYEQVEQSYDEHADEFADMLDARQMAGLALLERARRHWKSKELDTALELFARLRRLGVLENHIPAHADDHNITLGVQSLQQGDVEEAKKQFKGAADRADPESEFFLRGRIGALLCEWKADRSPRLKEPLAKIVERMRAEQIAGRRLAQTRCAHCDEKYRVPADYAGETVRCHNPRCRQEFAVELFDSDGMPMGAPNQTAVESSPDAEVTLDEAVLDRSDDRSADDGARSAEGHAPDLDRPLEGDVLLNERDRLAVNTMFWYAMVRLIGWSELPARAGLPSDEMDGTLEWLRTPLVLDPDFPDPQLVEGLLRYYFPRSDDEREQGFQILDRLSASTVTLTALGDLCNRERRHQQSQRDSLNRLFVIVTDYLGNAEVSERHRQKLRDRVKGLSQFKDVDASQVVKASVGGDPATLLADRAAMIREKVGRILSQNAGKGDIDPEEVETLVRTLTKQSEEFQETATRLQDAEVGLLSATSELVFSEELPPPPVTKDA